MDFQSDEYKALCADHQAICEFAGFQPFPDDVRDQGFIFYLEAKIEDETVVGLSIFKGVVSEDNAIYAKDEVLTALKKEMESTFPDYIVSPFDAIALPMCTEESYPLVMKQTIGSKVAMQTRRGAANTEFLDFFYYKGSNATDCPFIVYKFGDKYGIFKHPKADQYGFRLIHK